jgi:hypothetical protein
MIRYPGASAAELSKRVNQKRKGWLKRAAKRKAAFVAKGGYLEKESIWSEVKEVWSTLQHHKCLFCERKLSGIEHGGTVEHHLEHFRPKSDALAWPTDRIRKERKIEYELPQAGGDGRGYYWLAYDIENYAVACGACNSPLKSSFFPIAGRRTINPGLSVAELNAIERPYLLFPLGDHDVDPSAVITFNGFLAVPVERTGFSHWRARVTIDLLELNRAALIEERVRVLLALDDALYRLEAADAESSRKAAGKRIDILRSNSEPHAGCVRAALRWFAEDRSRALDMFTAVREYAESNHTS